MKSIKEVVVEEKSHIKSHLIWIVLLAVISIIYLHSYFSTTNIHQVENRVPLIDSYDYSTNILPVYEIMRSSLLEYKQFPLWEPFRWAGYYFWGMPDSPLFYITSILLIILPSAIAAINFMAILHLFLAGFSAYLLVFRLVGKKKPAFLSALIYMFNGYAASAWYGGWLVFIPAYALFPLLLFFIIKAFEDDGWQINTIITGVLLALMFHSGGGQIWYGTLIGLSLFAVFYFFFEYLQNKFSHKAKKILLIFILIMIICAGLTAIRLIPNQTFSEDTNRNTGFSLEEAKQPVAPGGEYNSISNFIKYFFLPNKLNRVEGPAGISAIGWLMVLLSLFALKKRNVLIFFLLAITGFLIASGSFLFSILWAVLPNFDKFRAPPRFIFITLLSLAVLAGYGCSHFFNWLEKRFNDKKIINITFIILVVLVLVELCYSTIGPVNYMMNYKEEYGKYSALNEISHDKEMFRLHSLDISGVEGKYQIFTVPLKISTLYSYTANIWFPEYMNDFLVVSQQNPSKIWGLMNVKYVFSKTKANITGLKLIKEYPKCDDCMFQRLAASNLYLNENYLPRYFFVNKAILVFGEEEKAKEAEYYLLLDERFNPKTSVVVQTDNLKDISAATINKAEGIMLISSPTDPISTARLQDYSTKGMLIPNIFKGEQQITKTQMTELLTKTSGEFEEIKVLSYSPNKIELNLNGEEGFIVLSEHFWMFEGWHAFVDGKETTLFRADGGISAVSVEKGSKILELKYSPKSFKTGLLISLFTLIAVVGYLVYYWKNKKN